MFKLFYHPSPNPVKVALFLEEVGLEYEIIPIDTKMGMQFKPEYLAINPNSKVPALVDDDVIIFDSSAIMLYLAEKTGKFLGDNSPAGRGKLLSWLMFVASGVGPFIGQAAHFRHQLPGGPKGYAFDRFDYEADRHYTLLDKTLANNQYMLGNCYTIIDMSVVVWSRIVPRVMGDEGWDKYPNLKRHYEEIIKRPAFLRADALKESSKFKLEMDDEARSFLFPHINKKT